MPDPLPPQGNTSLQQTTTGDRNQAIGQVLGGIVVYVSGGQAIFHPASIEPTSADSKPTSSGIGPNPYKGLMAFQETDGDRFFGREKQIAALWERLRSLHETESAIRILPIYGPSGSGKSSLARAGLIPELARHPIPGYDRARVAVLVPGTHPLESLAAVLARIVTQDLTPVAKTREFAGELQQVNETGEYDGLRRIADVMLGIDQSPLIILVDQAEEVHTLCEDQTERIAFVRNLLYAAADKSKRVSVIVTLRSDFLGQTQKYPTLNRLFSDQGFLVPVMNREELRQAIRKPAELAGHPLDEATIDLLIEQTHGRDGVLPLLQFTLTRIWEGLEEGISTSVTLEQIGGVGGALAGEAQRVYDSLAPNEQAVARRMFLGAVQLGEGTRDTRRRVPFDMLLSYKEDSDLLRKVTSRFAAPGVRLVTCSANAQGTEVLEVTHEALFDHWQLLQQWLSQSRDDLRFQRRLEDAAQYWYQNGRPDGNLWRPPDLDLLRQYQQRAGDNLTPLQVQFFKVSENSENQRKQFRRMSVGGLAAGFLVAVGMATFALYQWQRAETQKQQAILEQIKSISSSSRALFAAGEDFDALITSLRALREIQRITWTDIDTHVETQAIVALQEAVYRVLEHNRLEKHADQVRCVAFSPDGKTIASGGADGKIILWSVDGKLLHQWDGHNGSIIDLAFSPDGQILASGGGSQSRTLKLWRLNGELIREIPGYEDGIEEISFSPNGQMVAVAGADKTLKLLTIDGKLIRKIDGDRIFKSVDFSPDGNTLVTGSANQKVQLWKRDGSLIRTFSEQSSVVEDVAFSPNGKMIASLGRDGRLRLWTNEGKLLKEIQAHDVRAVSIAFDSEGQMLASASYDGKIKLWHLDGTLITTLSGHDDAVYSVEFSPQGRTIASASADKTVKLWQVPNSLLTVLLGHQEEVASVEFAPDGQVVMSTSNDNVIKLWTLDGDLLNTLKGHTDNLIKAVFSPNGKTIVSSGWDETIRLWRSDGTVIRVVPGRSGVVRDVSFNPSGKMIASAGADGTIKLWKDDGEFLRILGQHDKLVYQVAFSLDGQMLASASADKTVRLWRLDGTLVAVLSGHSNSVLDVEFSPDGQILASASADETVKLWQLDGTLIATLRHQGRVRSLGFSPDSQVVATASLDKTITLWRRDGSLITTLVGHQGGVVDVSFSPDGNILASGSNDRSIFLWKLPEHLAEKDSDLLNSLIMQGCSWLNDYLLTNPNVEESDRQLCISTESRR